MRLVGDHHDVASGREQRERILVLARHELLDGGEHDATARPVAQQRAQLLPGGSLHRLLAQQVLRQAEHAEQLAVEVVAVCDDDDGRVLHQRVLHHARCKARHRDALAAALGVPDHAALAANALHAVGARRGDHLRDGRPHRVELVVAGDLLDQAAVILEQHEEAQVVQQVGRCQHAAHKGLQLVERAERVDRVAVDRAPGHEALGVGRQRAQQRVGAVGDHQHLVVLEGVGDLFLVGLDLVKGLPDVGVRVGRVLQLDQHQRQAVDEQDDVGPARVVRAGDAELVDRQPLVARRRGPIDELDEIAPRFAVALVLHRHAGDQQPMELPVRRQQHRRAQVHHLLYRVVTRRLRHVGVQRGHGPAQPIQQQRLAVVAALGRAAIRRQLRPIPVLPAHVGQPAQGLLFELVFGHGVLASPVGSGCGPFASRST